MICKRHNEHPVRLPLIAVFCLLAIAPCQGFAAEVLTPQPPATPRMNGAKVFGVRPGHPILYTIAATGDRPMNFAADGLPTGVTLDAKAGFLGGQCEKPGEY